VATLTDKERSMDAAHTVTVTRGATGAVVDGLSSRWAAVAGVGGMVAWVIGLALIATDAEIGDGDARLVAVLRDHSGRPYAAALLAVLGALPLVAFFAAFTRLVPEGRPGWGLRHAGLAAPWVMALGWLSAALHLVVLFTLTRRGALSGRGCGRRGPAVDGGLDRRSGRHIAGARGKPPAPCRRRRLNDRHVQSRAAGAFVSTRRRGDAGERQIQSPA
jgi:hypothetical protein